VTTFSPTVLLRAEQTSDQVSVIENRVPARWGGPPLHHHDFDEAFYVLEGELTFQLGDEVFTRTAGELAFAPRNVAHTYANHSDAAARALLVCTPAGFERYFARMAAERSEGAARVGASARPRGHGPRADDEISRRVALLAGPAWDGTGISRGSLGDGRRTRSPSRPCP
jgi:mannose-6-phosphate isomerase-like protein (cupin superfamily)